MHYAHVLLTGYHARPIAISPKCRSGTTEAQERTQFKRVRSEVVAALEPYGGQLTSCATDSAAQRVSAWQPELSSHDLQDVCPEVYSRLKDLPYFSTKCGPFGEDMGQDWKHIGKGAAEAERGDSVHLILDVSITTAVIIDTVLEVNPGTSYETLTNVFTQGDKHNVKQAHLLLYYTSTLRDLPPQDPSDANFAGSSRTRQALRLFGQCTFEWINAFGNAHLDLSGQIEALSCHSFLLMALYRINGTSFMHKQAYLGRQRTIISIITGLAWAQHLKQPTYYICQNGTDVGEVLFCCTRAQGKHCSNCDLARVGWMMGTAAQLGEIYADSPELHPAAGHLSMGANFDHITPLARKGNQSPDSVNIASVYASGIKRARHLLQESRLWRDDSTAWAEDVTLLQPIPGMDQTSGTQEPDAETDAEGEDDPDVHDSILGMDMNELLGLENTAKADYIRMHRKPADELPAVRGKYTKADTMFEIDGRLVSKSQAVRNILNRKYQPTSHDRVFRVMGATLQYKRELQKIQMQEVTRLISRCPTDVEMLKTDETFALLLHSGSTVALAVGCAIDFIHDKVFVPALPITLLAHPLSSVRLSIISLEHFPASEDGSTAHWLWDLKYELFGHRSRQTFTVPGSLLARIPHIAADSSTGLPMSTEELEVWATSSAKQRDNIESSDSSDEEEEAIQPTFRLEESELIKARAQIEDRVSCEAPEAAVCKVGKSKTFPYLNTNGKQTLPVSIKI